MKKEFTKKYQVWQYSEGGSYYFEEFDTLEEAMASQKYGEWYLTKSVELILLDNSDSKEQEGGI